MYLVAEVDGAEQAGALAAVNEAVEADPAVASILGPQPNDPEAPTAVRWLVTPTGGAQDEDTTHLVDRLRDDLLPPAEEAAGTDVLVTGMVAANVDMSQYMSERMPIFFGGVLTLSFLLLMLVFRSLLVPLKAVIMNLLSIGAAYGIIIALFQWGWLSDLTGVEPGTHRDLGADDALRGRVRPLDGLRGVPALPDPGGVAPHRRQPHVGRRRPGRHRQGDQRRRRHHGRGLRRASCSSSSAP